MTCYRYMEKKKENGTKSKRKGLKVNQKGKTEAKKLEERKQVNKK